MDPLRLWYTVGTLEPMEVGPLVNVSRPLRTVITYRAAMTKPGEQRIEATLSYLACLGWALKHNAAVLDGTSFLWLREKFKTLQSNRGVVLEYFITQLYLAGLYVESAKRELKQQRGNVKIGQNLQLASQATTAAALHLQRHPECADPHTDSAAELMERARLLALGAQQELISFPRPMGALYLMRELHGFITSSRFPPMQAFARCMLVDWRVGLAQRMAAERDPRLMNKDHEFEQVLHVHRFIHTTIAEFNRLHKKDPVMKTMAPPSLVKHLKAVQEKTSKTLVSLTSDRAQVSMVSGLPIADLDPGPMDSDSLSEELFDDLDPQALEIQHVAFHEQLRLKMEMFTTGPARDMRSVRAETEPPLQDFKTYAYADIPLDKRKWVLWGALAERRHHLEEAQVLWPAAETDDELAQVIRLMGKMTLQ